MAKPVTKPKSQEGEVMVLQLLQTEPEQFTKIGALVWGMTGMAIGIFFIFISLIGLLLNFVPGLPHISLNGFTYLIIMSLVITFVLTIFYAMCGAALGSMLENSVNWILNKMGGIKFRVRKL